MHLPSWVEARERLAAPLDEPWLARLSALAALRGWPGPNEPRRLGPLVARLSELYNTAGSLPSGAERTRLLAARLGFSFARDVPKGAAAVAELALSGSLGFTAGEPLRVLDLGAGLGAATWGLVRALAAAGLEGKVEATLVDDDAEALALARAIVEAAGGAEGALTLSVATRPGDARAAGALPRGARYDVVLLGNVLSELDAGAGEAERAAAHGAWLLRLLRERVCPRGALVVVEPALRERTRHLQRVRDVLAASGAPPFAPCLHASACPMLAREHDWCHEDLAVDLPLWLRATAREAGLRYERLTFSYLALRADGARLGASVGAQASPFRLVAQPMRSKGKTEWLLCGPASGPGELARVRGLERERGAPGHEAIWQARRGELVGFAAPPGGRLGPAISLTALGPGGGEAASPVARRGLYALIDTQALGRLGVPIVPFAREVFGARPALAQLRAKGLGSAEFLDLLRQLVPIARAAGVPFFANDRVDLALLAGCDGVHVGQDDLPLAEVRRIAPGLLVGVSTHDEAQANAALSERPSYVAFGPVFATTSKERPDPVVGLERLGALVARAPCPIVAIGGIDGERAPAIAGVGAVGAVIGALLPAPGEGLAGVGPRARALHYALGGEPRSAL
ncbi:MAG: thiamine phosphate synthase [Polyangiaceae bacterium]|nr:thiamine phosphate synthase [Polyangiaceae bacterium]